MATTKATNTATKAPAKRKAPAPAAPATAAASHAKATQPAKGSKAQQAATPQAPLYTIGTMYPVRPGTHRAYAQETFKALAKANPKGFTLVQAREALVAGAAASSVAPPTGGWAKHNMPTWSVGQAWLVPVNAE